MLSLILIFFLSLTVQVTPIADSGRVNRTAVLAICDNVHLQNHVQNCSQHWLRAK